MERQHFPHSSGPVRFLGARQKSLLLTETSQQGENLCMNGFLLGEEKCGNGYSQWLFLDRGQLRVLCDRIVAKNPGHQSMLRCVLQLGFCKTQIFQYFRRQKLANVLRDLQISDFQDFLTAKFDQRLKNACQIRICRNFQF